jgi:hypothetical protein
MNSFLVVKTIRNKDGKAFLGERQHLIPRNPGTSMASILVLGFSICTHFSVANPLKSLNDYVVGACNWGTGQDGC